MLPASSLSFCHPHGIAKLNDNDKDILRDSARIRVSFVTPLETLLLADSSSAAPALEAATGRGSDET